MNKCFWINHFYLDWLQLLKKNMAPVLVLKCTLGCYKSKIISKAKRILQIFSVLKIFYLVTLCFVQFIISSYYDHTDKHLQVTFRELLLFLHQPFETLSCSWCVQYMTNSYLWSYFSPSFVHNVETCFKNLALWTP